jgi:hypothetical protein
MVYLAWAEERALAKGSYGEAGERGVLMDDIDPARDEPRSGILMSRSCRS